MAEDNTHQQFFNHLSKAKRVFIAIPPAAGADATGAASALALFLRKLEKEADIVAEADLAEDFLFLPKNLSVKNHFAQGKSFTVVVDTSKKALEELSYVQEQAKVKVFLKSRGEIFSPADISFEADKAPYDLGVILGAQSLEDLGAVFEGDAEIFYETPKINIDNHPGNKYFGSINLVDINSASLSEIVTGILQEFETNLFDEDIATALLSGIISKTQSFQHPLVSPKSFLKASELISLGARQQEIVKALFKTKPLPLLKLWGRALACLQDLGGAAMAVLTPSDFAIAGGQIILLPLVLKELAEHLSDKQCIALLSENSRADTKVFLAARSNIDWQEKFKDLGALKEHKNLLLLPFAALEYDLSMSLAEAEGKLTALLSKSFSTAS